jgi:hypothetical protein
MSKDSWPPFNNNNQIVDDNIHSDSTDNNNNNTNNANSSNNSEYRRRQQQQQLHQRLTTLLGRVPGLENSNRESLRESLEELRGRNNQSLTELIALMPSGRIRLDEDNSGRSNDSDEYSDYIMRLEHRYGRSMTLQEILNEALSIANNFALDNVSSSTTSSSSSTMEHPESNTTTISDPEQQQPQQSGSSQQQQHPNDNNNDTMAKQ